MENNCFEVGHWLVEPGFDRISNGGDCVNLRPLVMDLLVLLANHQNDVVSLDEMIEEVWRGKAMTSGSVYNCLNELRSAFGDDIHHPVYIVTIPKRGYRLIAKVRFRDAENCPDH